MRTNFGFGWVALARSVSIGVAIGILMLAAWSPAGAHDNGTTAHLWNHIQKMGEAGTINDSGNPVHWTKLKGVPSTIADGVDNIGVAAFGLKQAYGAYFVDTAKIQRRLTSSCSTGQAVKSVAQDGTVTCTAGPLGKSKRIADTGQICNVMCTEGSLALTPGTWAITAKITLNQSEGGERLYASCQLHAAGLVDETFVQVTSDAYYTVDTVQMQLIATYTESANTSVNCRDFDFGDVDGTNLSIIAIRLAD
jgi:hypothetical protein